MQCKIQGNGIDKDCNKVNFNATSCDYVKLQNKFYVCDEVKKNYTRYLSADNKVVQQCSDVCDPNSVSGWFYIN